MRYISGYSSAFCVPGHFLGLFRIGRKVIGIGEVAKFRINVVNAVGKLFGGVHHGVFILPLAGNVVRLFPPYVCIIYDI